MTFEGIHVPAVTPHREDGGIDRDGFLRVLSFLVAEGVQGVIVGGSTGEYYAQTLEEREELARLAREALPKGLVLTVGTGAIQQRDSCRMAEHAARIGADAILVSSPPYEVPTERENALNALAIDRAADLPVMLYNYPGRTGAMMGEEFLDRVGRSRNVRAIKESSGDINRVHLLARDYPHIAMLCGMDDQALEFFAWGAPGWVCGGGNFLPREHLALWRACAVEGDFAKGRRIMSAMLPLMRVLERGGKFVQCIKHGVAMRGLPAGPPRPPLKALNKDDKREFDQVVRVLRATVAAIGPEGRGRAAE